MHLLGELLSHPAITRTGAAPSMVPRSAAPTRTGSPTATEASGAGLAAASAAAWANNDGIWTHRSATAADGI